MQYEDAKWVTIKERKFIVENQAIKVDMPTKLLGYKPYNSIPHLLGSRLGEGDRHLQGKQGLYMVQSFPEDGRFFLFIEEKMDGSNCTVVRLNGEIRTLGRAGYDCAGSNQEQHRMFNRWVMKNKEKFEELLPNELDRCAGEWMALAHGTIYPNLESPYMIFDLFMTNNGKYDFDTGVRKLSAGPHPVQFPTSLRRQLVDAAGLVSVPLRKVSTTAVSAEDALKLVDDNAEGVVYRLEKVSKNHIFSKPYLIAKIVKMEKEDGKYLRNGQENNIWNWKEDEEEA